MASRKPLVNINGRDSNIPDDDTLVLTHLRTGGRVVSRVNVDEDTTLTKINEYVKQTESGITTKLDATPVDGQRYKISNRSGGSNTVEGNGKLIAGNGGTSSTEEIIFDTETLEFIFDSSTDEWDVF